MTFLELLQWYYEWYTATPLRMIFLLSLIVWAIWAGIIIWYCERCGNCLIDARARRTGRKR